MNNTGIDNETALRDELTGAMIGLVRVCNHKSRTPESDRLLLEGFTLLSSADPCPRSFSGSDPADSQSRSFSGSNPADSQSRSFSGSDPDRSAVLTSLIRRIHQEKNVISPGCAVCASPCGGTFDYNMSDLYGDPDSNIRSLKILLLFAAQGIAGDILRHNSPAKNGACLPSVAGNNTAADLTSETVLDAASGRNTEDLHIYLYRALMAVGDNCELDDLLMLLTESGDLHIANR